MRQWYASVACLLAWGGDMLSATLTTACIRTCSLVHCAMRWLGLCACVQLVFSSHKAFRHQAGCPGVSSSGELCTVSHGTCLPLHPTRVSCFCLSLHPQVAVKLLLDKAVAGNAAALAGQALSQSNPVMINLRQVGFAVHCFTAL